MMQHKASFSAMYEAIQLRANLWCIDDLFTGFENKNIQVVWSSTGIPLTLFRLGGGGVDSASSR